MLESGDFGSLLSLCWQPGMFINVGQAVQWRWMELMSQAACEHTNYTTDVILGGLYKGQRRVAVVPVTDDNNDVRPSWVMSVVGQVTAQHCGLSVVR